MRTTWCSVPLVGEGEEEEEIIAAWLKDNQNPALEHFLTDLRDCPDLAQLSQR